MVDLCILSELKPWLCETLKYCELRQNCKHLITNEIGTLPNNENRLKTLAKGLKMKNVFKATMLTQNWDDNIIGVNYLLLKHCCTVSLYTDINNYCIYFYVIYIHCM